MDIVHVASELAPTAKVGGLGDVIAGLSRALVDKGQHVTVFLPKYDCLALQAFEHLELSGQSFDSFFEGKWHHNKVWKGILNGVSVILIEAFEPYGFFERSCVYGADDDGDRFLYFCRAVLDYLNSVKWTPDVLHVHDWHAAIIPLLNQTFFSLPSKTVLTIHNIEYQGFVNASSLKKIGFSENDFSKEWVNLLEQGILYADAITTVSPTYAKEILTVEGGKGLEKVLRAKSNKLFGILNGIDEKIWNPKTDPVLPNHFDASEIKKDKAPFIENKGKVQAHVRHMFSLQEKKGPLVACVSRLVPQKGPEMIQEALFWTLNNGGQFILLGAASDQKIHHEFYQVKRDVMDTQFAHIELTYNEKLSHLVFGAADIIIVPSHFEPCGLTQMIGMRYGAIPVVRKTGGLADTVFDGINGFTFDDPLPEACNDALKKAFDTWFQNPSIWKTLLHTCMTTDFSWTKSAAAYLALYENIAIKQLL